jgi:hypothetical protein
MNIRKIRHWAELAGVSPAEIIAAIRHPEAWDWVFPHGPAVEPRALTADARAELHTKLEEIRTALMGKVREGNLEAAYLAADLAAQQAALR